MMQPRLLLAAALLAALSPLIGAPVRHVARAEIPPWPHEFQGRPLTQLPLDAEEQRFLSGFPGAVARFTDGQRDVVLRWVTRPTRLLHPAEDCYRGIGYEVSEARIHSDRNGARWRCFEARREGSARSVCEQLRDLEGALWTDVSSWYWAATLQQTQGPWLVTSISQRTGE